MGAPARAGRVWLQGEKTGELQPRTQPDTVRLCPQLYAGGLLRPFCAHSGRDPSPLQCMLSAPRATSFFHSTAPRCSLHSEPAAFRTLYFCPLTQHLYMPFPLPGTESFTFSSSGGGSPKSEPPLRASHTRSGHTPPAKGSSSSALVSVPGLGIQPALTQL